MERKHERQTTFKKQKRAIRVKPAENLKNFTFYDTILMCNNTLANTINLCIV